MADLIVVTQAGHYRLKRVVLDSVTILPLPVKWGTWNLPPLGARQDLHLVEGCWYFEAFRYLKGGAG